MDFGFSTLTPEMWIVLIWSLIWKGLALWYAAKENHKPMFVLFLILQDVGIVEIIYLAYLKYFRKKKKK